jgi:hypothetical protein
MRYGVGTVLVVALAAGPVGGCPVCGSETAERVRAGLVEGNVGMNLVAVVLPFGVLAGVVWGIHVGLGKIGRKP